MLEDGLSAHGLKRRYGRRIVVHDVDLHVRPGEVVGLLGPNGAGKTTCFSMIMGLVRPTAGQIVLDGEDVTGLPMHQRARLGLGYLAQEPSVFRGLNVENNIRAVLELSEPDGDRRAASLEALLAEFEISHLRHSSASSLSGGERRRVEIARALAGRPSILLLDEPFAGVDPIAVGDIRALIIGLRERGLGILMTDHNARETLGVTDRAVLLHDGRVLAEGTPQAIIADERVRRSYLGEDFTL